MSAPRELCRYLRITLGSTGALLLVLASISSAGTPTDLTRMFPDRLDIRNVPAGPQDPDAHCFFDLGAWHGFALPPDSAAYRGTFPGPFLMTHWTWLSAGLTRLELWDVATGEQMDLRGASAFRTRYYPGRLHQSFRVDSLAIELQLLYVSDGSALILTTITNQRDTRRDIRLDWSGTLLVEGATLSPGPQSIRITLPEPETGVEVLWPASEVTGATTHDDGRSYRMQGLALRLGPGETHRIPHVQSLLASPATRGAETTAVESALGDPERALLDNESRWNGYLSAALQSDRPWVDDPRYRDLAVKCLLTLISNWKAPIGALRHEGVIPSYNIHYFNGFWAWDSWKHAVALAPIAPDLARNQVRAMFAFQDSLGMVADCVFPDSTENNWRDTKPPLAAWAVWSIYEHTEDIEFLDELYPALVRYHRWWYRDRDHDGNGLCEYGSTDSTLVAARWESGMDNAVRFDGAAMLQNGDGAWSMDQESVDLNAYLYAEKLFLARMAGALGRESEAASLRAESRTVRTLVRERLFDPATGYFYDARIGTGDLVDVQGPEGWIPLWAELATAEQAKRVAAVMTDSTRFATYVPFPTVSRSHPEFSRGYWRGPVWLDQAYFGIRALERHGFTDEADRLTRRLFDHPEGLVGSTAPIRQNYDALTGEGLNVNHFSWSAAHLLMLFMGL